MITADSPLIDKPSGTLDAALDYAGTDNAEYVREVWRLCLLVGYDPAVLIAQSAHETADWTSHWWETRLNPAGIGITGFKPDDEASQIWATQTDAARGHVVHMAAYTALNKIVLNPYVYLDKRAQAVIDAGYFGKVKTIRDLTGKWATDLAYHTKIVAKHRAIFGVKENAADDTSDGASQGGISNVTKPTILLIAGHRSHGDAGNPVEKDMTDDLARAYRDAFRAAGYDVTWLQEADGDSDPDDTVGGLDTVSSKASVWCARQENGVLFDLHFEGTAPQVRGVFAIIPDVTGLTTGAPVAQHPQDTWDFNARDRKLGAALVEGISAVTGLPIRQGLRAPGLMDESQTDVGGQGYRLATFAYTSPWCPKIVRLVVEHGAHTNPQDLAIIRSPGFFAKCALAAVAAVNEVYDVDAAPSPPPAPQPSPIWWAPGKDWGPQTRTHDGAIAWAFLGEVRAKRDVPLRKDAHAKAEVVHRLKAGDAVQIVGTWTSQNKKGGKGPVWAFLEFAPGKYGRAPLSAFNPYRWPTV